MSEQTNAGFNAPGFSVGSDDPIKIAWPLSFGSPRLLTLPFTRSSASSATGVCQSACFLIATSPAELLASLLPLRAGANDVGVGHTVRPSSPLIGTFGQYFPSL
jgi:hypothetical protein